MGWVILIIIICIAWYFLDKEAFQDDLSVISWLAFFILIVGWVYIWDFPNAGWGNNKIIAYPVICSGNFIEFKPSWRFDQKKGKLIKVENPAKDGDCYQGTKKVGRFKARLPGELKPGTSIIYIVRPESSKVTAMVRNLDPYTLKNCNIFDEENWNCPGGPTVSNGDFKSNPNGKIKYFSQWRYRWFQFTHWYENSWKKKKKKSKKANPSGQSDIKQMSD